MIGSHRWSRTIVASASILLLLFLSSVGGAWGFWSHREIARQAVASVPPVMGGFFKTWADTIVAWSVLPDMRRNQDSSEGPRHFIDIDRYGSTPFKDLPREYDAAVRKFGKATVDTNGSLPWAVTGTLRRLTDAMRRKEGKAILAAAADLAHYVSDAYVPLHAASNYDGQLSGQRGIHSRWESGIPEQFTAGFKLGPGTAVYVSDPQGEIFRVILESAALVDSVLSSDLRAREGLTQEQLYQSGERRGRREPPYSRLYYDRLKAQLGTMVEDRFRGAISSVASYWYTAWVDAGKPDLDGAAW